MPPSNKKFLHKVNTAYNHYQKFQKYNQLKTNNHKYYEFGAGWNLTIPLAISHLSFEVSCVDIKKLIIPELVNDTLKKFQLNKNELPFSINKEIKLGDNNKIIKTLADDYQLDYFAPKDARNTGFDENYFDFMSSSVTLEHIPKEDIRLILKECYRILNKGGILSVTIDYQDHWSYFDKTISIYNYLKYSDRAWKKYNPSLHYQNRLRHSDYLELISETDFSIVEEVRRQPTEADKNVLKSLKISEKYQKYDFDDLAIRGCEIVLMK